MDDVVLKCSPRVVSSALGIYWQGTSFRGWPNLKPGQLILIKIIKALFRQTLTFCEKRCVDQSCKCTFLVDQDMNAVFLLFNSQPKIKQLTPG